MNSEKLVPRLRFSGFDDEWNSGKFDDLFNFQVAGDMKKELFNEELNDKFKYPLYANALENEGLLGYYKEYKYDSNTITVTARGNIGHATVRKNKFNAIGRLIMLTAKDDLNMDFFAEYINSNVKVHIESTGVPQLTAPSLKINKLNYPNLNEQNKISDFLIMLNKKIALLERKHLKYQDFKKYLMQQIFTQKSRFNFDDNLEIVKLSELTDKISSGKTNLKKSNEENGKYPIYGSRGIIGNMNNYDYDDDFILVARVGANAGSLFKISGKCKITDNTLIIKTNENIHDDFLFRPTFNHWETIKNVKN